MVETQEATERSGLVRVVGLCPKANETARKRAFTLVELLVVIAVIAVLVAILMPALSKAKRHAYLTLCCNNLRQVAVGLNTYCSEYQSHYQRRDAGYPALVYHTEGVMPDTRQMLVKYVAYREPGILFCPMAGGSGIIDKATDPGIVSSARGTLSPQQEEWSEYFWLDDGPWGGNPIAYRIGYNLFAGLRGDTTSSSGWLAENYNWIESGNESKEHDPRIPSSAKDCVAADVQEAWPSVPGWGWEGRPYLSNHAAGWITSNMGFDNPPDIEFIDSNAAYGDGHVERHEFLKFRVRRVLATGVNHGLFEY